LNGSAFSNYSSLSRLQNVRSGAPFLDTSGQPIAAAVYQGVEVPVYAYSQTTTQEKHTETDQLRDNLSKSFNFQLSIPIFNNWSQRATVQRAAIQTELARITEIETQNTLRQTIETAYNDASAAAKTYAANLKQVNAREEAYRMVLQRFEIGAANFVEKQVSENDLFQSKSDLTRAKYNFIFKKKILDFYQGKQIEY
jgi:outer membrane protein